MNKRIISVVKVASSLLTWGAVSVSTIVATAQDTVYAVSAGDASYLRYYTVLNTFDSCITRYEIGELRLRTGAGYSRVYLDTLLHTDSTMVNAPVTGVQANLRAVLRSRPFFIGATSDSIACYRQIALVVINETVGHIPVAWKVDDATEFVLQLVRASDNAVLAVLDSIGIASTPGLGTAEPTYYGTLPSMLCRKFFIPYSARSCTAYVRVVPKRFGPSPYGMEAFGSRERYSLSASQTCTNASMGTSFSTIAETKFLEKLLAYYDTFLAQTCTLPGYMPSLNDWQADIVNRRYFDTVCTSSGSFLRLKSCTSGKMNVPSYPEQQDAGTLASVRCSYGTLHVRGSLATAAQVAFEIYDVLGNVVEVLGARSYASGEFTDTMPFDAPAGMYIVGFRNITDDTWMFRQFVKP